MKDRGERGGTTEISREDDDLDMKINRRMIFAFVMHPVCVDFFLAS